MDCIRFYDTQVSLEEPMLIVNADHRVRPAVGDCIYNNGNKYKVIEICIDYYKYNFDVFLEKISW